MALSTTDTKRRRAALVVVTYFFVCVALALAHHLVARTDYVESIADDALSEVADLRGRIETSESDLAELKDSIEEVRSRGE